ncbi:MAG TPA: hypothetical protein VHO06_17010 [Polyangia bacterium]|nr:hypothetical protein [Polyangia bacterium]
MKLGFFVDPDTTRFAGLRLRRLREAIKDPRVQAALVDELQVTGATGADKMPAIERRIEALRATEGSPWFEVPAAEVLAASIFKAPALAEVAAELWKRVARVQELAAPLAGWLNLAGLTPHAGTTPATGRANVIGYRGGGVLAATRVVAIEATNDAGELGRALDELAGARQYASAAYLACTPALVAELLWARAAGGARWDAGAIGGRLRAAGFGLLLVEGDAVAQAVLPRERKVDRAKLGEIVAAVMPNGR